MSLFDTFDPNSEELIKVNMQRSFYEVADFPEVVIGAFKEETFRALAQVASAEVICSLRGGRTIPVYRLHWQGRDVGLFHSLMGGAGTVCLMESLIARGAKAFLYYGNCGVLNKEIAAGHLILPNAAYRDEGASYHYLPVSDYVEIPTHAHLSQILDELHLPYVSGKVWTTDAFYRETRNNMENRKADGCLQLTWNVHPSWRLDSSVVCRCISFSMRMTVWTAKSGTPERWAQGHLPAMRNIFG